MKHFAIPATLLASVFALPSFGADLTVGLDGGMVYDSNVFRRDDDSPRDVEDDFLFRLRPSVSIHEDRGQDLNFGVTYQLPLEFAVEFSDELNDVDHVARGHLRYHLNDRVDLFASERFGSLRSVVRQEIEDDRGPDISSERERVRVNYAQMGFTYRSSPRLVYTLVASSDLFDSTRSDRARAVSVGASGDALYALTHDHQIGGGARFNYQDFSDRLGIAGSQVNTYNIFGSWRWNIDDTTVFDARVGPSFLDSEQDDADVQRRANPTFLVPLDNGDFLVATFLNGSGGQNCQGIRGRAVLQRCVLNQRLDANDDKAVINAIRNTNVRLRNIDPGGASDENVNVFAEITLRKNWSPTLNTALRYLREQGHASGLGGTVIRDAISLSNLWRFARFWSFTFRADWTRRSSIFDTRRTFDQAVAIDEEDIGLVDGQFPGGAGQQLAGRCDPGGGGCGTGISFNDDRNAEIETDRWTIAGRITRRLFRSTLVWVQVRYDVQDSRKDTLGSVSDFENTIGTFGVEHTFEPIKLW